MTSNDIFRRLRYAFDFDDSKMIALFALADSEVTRAEISDWLKQDDDLDFQECPDIVLATFLNGLIIDKRGKKDGPQHPPEEKLTNNIVLRKLKIALELKDDDLIEILARVDIKFSRHELSAFFRKPGHKHYRQCLDQFLRNFLDGLQSDHRPEPRPKPKPKVKENPYGKTKPKED